MANGIQVEYIAKELSQLSNRRFAETTQTVHRALHTWLIVTVDFDQTVQEEKFGPSRPTF